MESTQADKAQAQSILEWMAVGQVDTQRMQHPPVDGASCRMLVHVQLQSFCYLHFAVVVCHALHRIVLIIMTRK